MFYLIMPNKKSRDKLISWLKKSMITSVFHYVPLHNSEMSKKLGWDVSDCSVTIEVSDRIIRLPIFYNLEAKNLDYIISKVLDFNPSLFS